MGGPVELRDLAPLARDGHRAVEWQAGVGVVETARGRIGCLQRTPLSVEIARVDAQLNPVGIDRGGVQRIAEPFGKRGERSGSRTGQAARDGVATDRVAEVWIGGRRKQRGGVPDLQGPLAAGVDDQPHAARTVGREAERLGVTVPRRRVVGELRAVGGGVADVDGAAVRARQRRSGAAQERQQHSRSFVLHRSVLPGRESPGPGESVSPQACSTRAR